MQDGRPVVASEAIFKYINSDFSGVRWVVKTNEMSYSANSGFCRYNTCRMIPGIHFFLSVLTFKFKMAAQIDCRYFHIESQKKLHLLIQTEQKGK